MLAAAALVLSWTPEIEAADCTMICKDPSNPKYNCKLEVKGCVSCQADDNKCTMDSQKCSSIEWSGGAKCTT